MNFLRSVALPSSCSQCGIAMLRLRARRSILSRSSPYSRICCLSRAVISPGSRPSCFACASFSVPSGRRAIVSMADGAGGCTMRAGSAPKMFTSTATAAAIVAAEAPLTMASVDIFGAFIAAHYALPPPELPRPELLRRDDLPHAAPAIQQPVGADVVAAEIDRDVGLARFRAGARRGGREPQRRIDAGPARARADSEV